MSHRLLIFAVVLLTSCRALVGPDHSAPQVSLPAHWNNTDISQGEGISRTWWIAFGDAELNRLETLALSASPDIARAMARVDEARASLRGVKTARFPILTGSSSATRSQQSVNVQQSDSSQESYTSQPQEVTTYNLQTDLNFELDLWGKIRRNIEASKASTDSIILNGQAVRLRLTAQVAENYFNLRGLEDECNILQDTVQLRQANVSLTTERQQGGLTSEVDVSRAQTELATTKAEWTDLRRRRQISLHALAALCGQPATGFAIKTRKHRIPSFAPQTPAVLLRERPDIAEAERTVAARSAEIGVAQANRLPSITLKGSAGLESLSLSDLVGTSSKKFSFGPQIDLPIFNAGALKAKSAQAKARHTQAVADYRSTVLTALKEAEDALTNIKGYAFLTSDYAAAVAAAAQAAKLSKERYEQGSANYLEVTDAQREVLTNQRRLAQSRSLQAQAAVQLAKAFGGGGLE